MRICFYRKLLFVFLFFVSSFLSSQIFAGAGIDKLESEPESCCFDEYSKSVGTIIEKKSLVLFNNIMHLMYKCDKCIDFWRYRKNNLGVYFLSSGKVINFLKSRADLLSEIDKKIEFFEKKKSEYAIFAGNLYKIAEPFIEGLLINLKESDVNILVKDFAKKIDGILPANYSENYFVDECKAFKKNMPNDKNIDVYQKYYLAGAATIAIAVLLYKYRDVLCNFIVNFFSNQIVKPLRGLKDWFLLDTRKDVFMSLSPQDMLKDLEAQKSIIMGKVRDLAQELNPDLSKEALENLIEQAKVVGVEGIVAKIIKKARAVDVNITKTKTKPSWLEWFLVGNKINEILGMSAKGKLIELEIKALLSRLVVTRLLVDAKDGIDSNRMTVVLGSMLPIVLTSFCVCKIFSKYHEWYHEIPKKRKDVDNMVLKISDIINKNIVKNDFDAQDQGLLCYFVYRFKRNLEVVSEQVRSSIARDLSHISSGLNCTDKKLQILQGLKIMLYIK